MRNFKTPSSIDNSSVFLYNLFVGNGPYYFKGKLFMILNIAIQLLLTIIGCLITYHLAVNKEKKRRINHYRTVVSKQLSYLNETNVDSWCCELTMKKPEDFWKFIENENIENVYEFIEYLKTLDLEHNWPDDVKNKFLKV